MVNRPYFDRNRLYLQTAYELTGATHKKLLERAVQLGDKLMHGWTHPDQKIPHGRLNFTTNEPDHDSNSAAGVSFFPPNITSTSPVVPGLTPRFECTKAGTLMIEFDRLSHYSGNDTYRRLADRTMKTIMGPSLRSLIAQYLLKIRPFGDYRFARSISGHSYPIDFASEL